MNPYEPPQNHDQLIEQAKSAGRWEVLFAVVVGAIVAFGIVFCWKLLGVL